MDWFTRPLLWVRRDRIWGVVAGRHDDDDLARAERLAVAARDVSRDPAVQESHETRQESTPPLARDPRAIAGHEQSTAAVLGDHRDVLLAHAGIAQDLDRRDRGIVVLERGGGDHPARGPFGIRSTGGPAGDYGVGGPCEHREGYLLGGPSSSGSAVRGR